MSVVDDATLLKMAEAELLGEAKRAAVRHSIAGVSGWQPCPKPNKTFLTNTLLQTISSNRVMSKKQEDKKVKATKFKVIERKLLQKNKKNERTNFVFQKPKKTKDKSEHDKKNSEKDKLGDEKYFKKRKSRDESKSRNIKSSKC